MQDTTAKIDPEELALKAERGEDINRYFTEGEIKPPAKFKVKRVNIDFSLPMLEELDEYANNLNISRQAVIKSLLKDALLSHK
ncbi:hypothetical protein [Oceanispirochaeta sp.]|jgi:hypothetical protein|uniref:hypothetical protein n=1 Tax=Oceanispirochaeta sp. TaxID=2035350 RepID=UPI002621AD95|nr:hypothetical protein [Oceanispirochaeta sp.]MDA3957068.1 hypothetical protein [Oceanispirochaeta sp.]